jgi:dihydrolipoamide dehydrogenase
MRDNGFPRPYERALGEPEGLVKTIFDTRTGQLLGHDRRRSDGIDPWLRCRKATRDDELELMDAVFPHPTLSEAMHESVPSAYDRAIHF